LPSASKNNGIGDEDTFVVTVVVGRVPIIVTVPISVVLGAKSLPVIRLYSSSNSVLDGSKLSSVSKSLTYPAFIAS